jgi:GNAT superfamily N-acetyltransferase
MEIEITIEEWLSLNLRIDEAIALVEQLGQSDWVAFSAEWHLSSHMLVALSNNRVVGFLRYVVQEIGVEEDQAPFCLNSETLREAKVIAFGVVPEWRRKGIGRALQNRLISDSKSKGLYQIRSHSSEKNTENHYLKASLGFGIQPLPVGQGKEGYYFILPLK